MPKLTLTYFDIDAARGETARLALHIAGIPFEDRRIAFKEWPNLKNQMPFLAMPVLEVDGRIITQSNSINRYVGKLAGLYPKDDFQALLCDEVMDAIEDISKRIEVTLSLAPEEKKKAREDLAAGHITRYLQQLEIRLNAAGGEYFAGKQLTVADLKVFLWVRFLKSGQLDHVPPELLTRHSPQLLRHLERVGGHPKVAAYYSERKKAA